MQIRATNVTHTHTINCIDCSESKLQLHVLQLRNERHGTVTYITKTEINPSIIKQICEKYTLVFLLLMHLMAHGPYTPRTFVLILQRTPHMKCYEKPMTAHKKQNKNIFDHGIIICYAFDSVAIRPTAHIQKRQY